MFKKAIFHGGVHPPENKLTGDAKIERIEDISLVRIPMNMHIGAPCTPIVKKGDKVDFGQVIGEPSGIAVPIHASVSGTVKSVKKTLLGTGVLVDVVEIENDFENRLHESIKPPKVETKEEFLKAVRDSGIVGLGGAGFPTHIKLNPPPDQAPDLLLINAMECEPYITSDDRQCVEQPNNIIRGIELVLQYLGIPKAIIGMESNKLKASQAIKEAIRKKNMDDKVSIKVMPTRYPQGAEKTLIQALTGRIVPAGALPSAVHVIVMNVSTLNMIETYFRSGLPLTRKVLTLSGNGVNKPGNYFVPIGTRISELVEKVGGFKDEPKKILMGGPMMGIAVSDIDTSIVKNNNAILVFNQDISIGEELNCINCGRCLRACPMKLMPTKLDKASRKKDYERLDHFLVQNCIECGCCTYVCPSKRTLVQNIRIGKGYHRAEGMRLKAEREAKEKKEAAK